jgi:hypothetical protein
MRRSRFCASLLERRQCELAELDRSVVSLDHDRTRLGRRTSSFLNGN